MVFLNVKQRHILKSNFKMHIFDKIKDQTFALNCLD